jgi:hypothetical protein
MEYDMNKIIRALHNMFIAVGFGTMVYVPMLLLDKGLNDTMQSVLTWVFASVLYGLSFEIIEIKSKIKYPIHIAVCFIITIATRLIYSYIENGKCLSFADEPHSFNNNRNSVFDFKILN